jgi:hypothetical protein
LDGRCSIREEADMSVGSTVKWVGRSARDRAEIVGHQLKDRALEKRLERAHEETERLRRENDMLRDEVSESRSEHKKILDLLERRLEVLEDVEVEKKSHKGRWLLFLMALGGGAYAWVRMRANGNGAGEWSGTSMTPTATETSASTL